jgi:hypothetical protein
MPDALRACPGWDGARLLCALKGLKPGERVVTEGSFFLRPEAARLRSDG